MSSAKPITKKGLEWLPVFFFFFQKNKKHDEDDNALLLPTLNLLLDAQCRCRGLLQDGHISAVVVHLVSGGAGIRNHPEN